MSVEETVDVRPEDVELDPQVAVVPWTGEALALKDMEDDVLAKLLDVTREFERGDLAVFKRQVQDEWLSRMDREATYTRHLDRFTVTGDSPGGVEYDVDQKTGAGSLRDTLDGLVERDLISRELADSVIVPKTKYEVSKAAINKLKRLPAVKAEIEQIETQVEKPRYVNVKPKGVA